jgi:hypothetical protein
MADMWMVSLTYLLPHIILDTGNDNTEREIEMETKNKKIK